MCRIFGLIASGPVSIWFSMLRTPNALIKQSQWHRDGWGIGYYEDGTAKLTKEPLPAVTSREFAQISERALSTQFVAHVRRLTTGGLDLDHTHPFRLGNWMLAHNGGIGYAWHKTIRKEVGTATINGCTSGEHLLAWLYHRAAGLQREEQERAIRDSLQELRGSTEPFRSANFILTTGERLYAFRFAPEGQTGRTLYYVERRKSRFPRSSNRVVMNGESQEGTFSRRKEVVIVASERLTSHEDWRPVENGVLLIVDQEVNLRFSRIVGPREHGSWGPGEEESKADGRLQSARF